MGRLPDRALEIGPTSEQPHRLAHTPGRVDSGSGWHPRLNVRRRRNLAIRHRFIGLRVFNGRRGGHIWRCRRCCRLPRQVAQLVGGGIHYNRQRTDAEPFKSPRELTDVLFPQVKTSTGIVAYLVGIASAFGVSVSLFRLLEPMRRSGKIARFIARFWIIGSFYFTLTAVMAIIAGPYIFAGPTRLGGYNSDPLTFPEVLLTGLIAGVLGAVMWPIVRKGRNSGVDM